MRQNYFIHNGKQYNSGDKVILDFLLYKTYMMRNANATFLYYNPETREYHIEFYGEEYVYEEKLFYKKLCSGISPRAPTSTNCKEYTFTNELNVDGLFIAWIWYIFIMAIAIIFYDRIAIWILASVIFFGYRNKKLKEAGYK
jgi:hypothetical protein